MAGSFLCATMLPGTPASVWCWQHRPWTCWRGCPWTTRYHMASMELGILTVMLLMGRNNEELDLTWHLNSLVYHT